MLEGGTLVWFRQDLRLADNPALHAAVRRGQPVLPVFVWAPDEEAPWAPGAAKRWWVHQALEDLQQNLGKIGLPLILRQGPTLETLQSLIQASGVDAVYWNRRYEPAVIARDQRVKSTLAEQGTEVKSFNGHLLYEPWEVETQTGTPYKVFTPFWRAAQALAEPQKPLPKPAKSKAQPPNRIPASDDLGSLGLLPDLHWADGFTEHWDPTEAGAQKRLKRFLRSGLSHYKQGRDYPSLNSVSGLSPYLANGQISPRTIWYAAKAADLPQGNEAEKSLHHFKSELGWREFAYHVLYHFPHTPERPLQEKYTCFPWAEDQAGLHRWQTGRTGYPLIDAGMRQLWLSGWMHNRVRMVVASFLVKDLLISWEEGARWFWDCLVDADLASNTLGWQWAGGCGADAAPYFRIFNPMTQSKKFDAEGKYIRQWVPELQALANDAIHEPAAAKPMALVHAGVTLDTEAAQVDYAYQASEGAYPTPVVHHADARDRALEALQACKQMAN